MLEKALALNSNLAFVHNNWGAVFMDLGHVDEAIEKFHRAVQIHLQHQDGCAT
jgi:Tfp pilus assembly protein PilF